MSKHTAASTNHGVAAQVECEKANFETRRSLYRIKGWNITSYRSACKREEEEAEEAEEEKWVIWMQLVQPHHGRLGLILHHAHDLARIEAMYVALPMTARVNMEMDRPSTVPRLWFMMICGTRPLK
jgi:hypothetical protein